VFALLGFGPMLIDFGTTDASVRNARITRTDVSTLFALNVAVGIFLTLLLIGASPFIAAFYGEPALTKIVLASSLTLIASALSLQHYALMRRAMEFQRLAMIEIVSNVLSCAVAIAMAWTGWGYWALVARTVLSPILIAVGVWLACPWLPGRPQMTQAVRQMLRFGAGVTGFTMTDHLARSTDRVALGYFYGANALGFYQSAFLLYDNVLGLLTQPLHNVAVSSLSKVKDDVVELKRLWGAALSSLSFLSCLCFAGLAVTGRDLVVILLGPKWEPAGILLCVFAVRGIAHVVERSLGWLHVAAGRSDRWTRWGVFSSLFQLAALLVGVPFGLLGVVSAHAIATFCLFVPALVYAGQPFGISTKDVLRTVGPQMVAALATVAVGLAAKSFLFADYSQLMRFLLCGLTSVATYLVITVGIFRILAPIHLALSLVRGYLPIRLPGRS
jgi:PST family polysaccharide transporter